jgi:hypothetical protein
MPIRQLLILDRDGLGARDSPTLDRCGEVLIYLGSLSEAYLFRRGFFVTGYRLSVRLC